jgi:YVTN family beta-propeller protein
MLLLVLALAGLLGQQPAAQSADPGVDFEFFRTEVQPIFLAKREGNVRCATCHAGGASSAFRLQPLSEGATFWDEAQSRQNFEAVQRLIVPGGSPMASRLLKHPLAAAAGGDPFHGGGKHWQSQDDPEWRILAAWVSGERRRPATTRTAVRIIQTNAAGDGAHVIDPVTNAVVGVIGDIEIPHGVTSAPDGSRVYITNESMETVDVVDSRTLRVIRRIKLSGRPNNLTITPDGRHVYAGIAENPGALDLIDTATLTNVKTIPVRGSVHNVYVTPDGKFVVSGSVASRFISIVDVATNEMVRTIEMSAGIRPMAFERNADGSTKRIFVQLSNFHGFAAVDFNTGQEVARIEHPAIPDVHAHTDGLQSAPAHGLLVSPDGTRLWSTSKVYGYAYVYSLPDLKEVGRVFVGQHPEWLTQTPDGKLIYVAAAGDNAVFVVDAETMKEVKRIPVGQVPKRNGTAIMQLP